MFLRDYLYVPLGGNRCGEGRRNANLLITMLLGGLWHGAAWSFAPWGGLHGLYQIIHHQWRRTGWRLHYLLAQSVTKLAVMLAWVPFRAGSLASCMIMTRGLLGRDGVALPMMLLKAFPASRAIATPVAVLPYLGAARTLSVVQGGALRALAWAIILLTRDVHSLSLPGRNAALIAGFAFSMQSFFFAPFAQLFIYSKF
jgi:hypothetical protein